MQLKVSRRRRMFLSVLDAKGAGLPLLYGRERRALVKGGHAAMTEADAERLAAAEAKRDRKAAARAARA